MIKRLLSIILVLTVFLGGYSLLPKKYNPLPVNDVSAATTFRPGYYLCIKTFVSVTLNTTDTPSTARTPIKVISAKAYNIGELVYIDNRGYDGKNFLASDIKNFVAVWYTG
ncbi:MAG: hypothetical protein J6U23_14230 [Clostridiales bacterium]|nr:hypothetical protein [Clostridiales bacterium]